MHLPEKKIIDENNLDYQTWEAPQIPKKLG